MPRTTARVLVVDDDLSVVQLLANQLEEAGYDVVWCLDPLDALAQCEQSRIDLFMTDWHMPGFSGLELLEVLQQKYPRVRRALVTAAPDEPEVREGLASGLVHCLLEKPWGRSELLGAVAAVLSEPQL